MSGAELCHVWSQLSHTISQSPRSLSLCLLPQTSFLLPCHSFMSVPMCLKRARAPPHSGQHTERVNDHMHPPVVARRSTAFERSAASASRSRLTCVLAQSSVSMAQSAAGGMTPLSSSRRRLWLRVRLYARLRTRLAMFGAASSTSASMAAVASR